jgi:UDP-glucuronate decarboxylase
MDSSSRNLIIGGAGFVGSDLLDRMIEAGEEVICLANFFTGRKSNLGQWIGHPRFELIRHDVIEPIRLEVDRIWHLACPASPVDYQFNPIKTAKTSFLGTNNMLGLARRGKPSTPLLRHHICQSSAFSYTGDLVEGLFG